MCVQECKPLEPAKTVERAATHYAAICRDGGDPVDGGGGSE